MQTVASLSARTAVVQTRLGSRRVATSRTVRRAATPMAAAKSFYDLSAKDIDGNDVSFEKFKGKVVLVTNVACKWGATRGNYQEMSAMAKELGPKGLEIVCFPCNQFGWQEPGSEAEIKKFVEDKFDFKGVGVNMMSKIDVNGGKTHPVWQFLKEKHPGDVRWNFAAKFIIDSEGNVVERNGDSAGASKAKIEALLKPLVPAWTSRL